MPRPRRRATADASASRSGDLLAAGRSARPGGARRPRAGAAGGAAHASCLRGTRTIPTRRSASSPRCGECRPRTHAWRRSRRASTPRLVAAMQARGVASLYTHQAAAVAHALAGRNVVVTTPTASGKTLCYNIPVLNAILTDPSTRALYLFPTKALAQDQLAELDRLAQIINESAGLDLGVFTYDGDTPQDARRAIRVAGAGHPDQPGHAALGDPAAPSEVGAPLREPAVRRHRRAARVPRRLRQPPRQRPAPAAPHLRALRLGPGLHLLFGDDRQPGGAGRAAHRAAVRAGGARAARRAARSSSSSSTRRSSTSSSASAARTRRKRAASRSSSCGAACRSSSSRRAAW